MAWWWPQPISPGSSDTLHLSFSLAVHRCSNFRAAIALLIIFVASVKIAVPSDAAQTSAEAVDLRPAVVIGGRPTSFYIFNKYYLRFNQTFTSEQQHPPNHEDTRLWLQHFVAQRLVIREAESLQYFNRAEVQLAVSRLERHMIMTQTGPLFQKVTKSDPHPDSELEKIYANSGKVLEGVLVRFDDKNSQAKALGPDFESAPVEEQTRRVKVFQKGSSNNVFDGRLTWPYGPFNEIATVLPLVKVGRWVIFQDPSYNFGQYLIFVRATSSRPLKNFEAVRSAFLKNLTEVEKHSAWKRFRLEKLSRSKLSINTDAVKSILQFCLNAPLQTAELPEMADPVSAATFFQYSNGTKTINVSGAAYRRWLNDAIVRKLPTSENELRESVRDYVIEQLSLDYARAKSIDSDPQFAEDRRGFEALQVLDLYEREVLVPQIDLKSADVERYYEIHSQEMQQTTAIKGKLLAFKTNEDAAEWIQLRIRNSQALPQVAKTPVSESDLTVTLDHPVPGLESAHYQMMHGANGMIFGPLTHGESYLVFVKEEDVTTDLIPLVAVEGTIRNHLLRPLLEELEDKVAVQIAGRYKVEDHIEYSRFGIASIELSLPWAIK